MSGGRRPRDARFYSPFGSLRARNLWQLDVIPLLATSDRRNDTRTRQRRHCAHGLGYPAIFADRYSPDVLGADFVRETLAGPREWAIAPAETVNVPFSKRVPDPPTEENWRTVAKRPCC